MSEIAFVTHQGSPGINDDDCLVAEILRQRGVTVTAAVWDAPEINWARFDCVIIRSAWDYHLKSQPYATWLRSFLDSSRRLWNPPQAVLENMNKKYLTALADRGVDVVPTMYLRVTDEVVLQEVLTQRGWQESVIKPAVSACAQGTWRSSLATANADQDKFAEQVRGQDLLIQPYMPELASQGEWSLVFFGGQYSHAVLKRPAKGDFRVQREFGGNSTAAEPGPSLIEQAQSVLAAVDFPLLYARVDGIERAGRFILMELEINEPFLFLGFSASAAQRFADTIMAML